MKHRVLIVFLGLAVIAAVIVAVRLFESSPNHLLIPPRAVETSSTSSLVNDAITGPPDSRVEDAIPDLTPPRSASESFSRDPTLGIFLSRTQIMLIFRRGTTVASANEILRKVNARVFGGDKTLRLLILEIPDSIDLENIKATSRLLKASESVEWVSIDKQIGPAF